MHMHVSRVQMTIMMFLDDSYLSGLVSSYSHIRVKRCVSFRNGCMSTSQHYGLDFPMHPLKLVHQ